MPMDTFAAVHSIKKMCLEGFAITVLKRKNVDRESKTMFEVPNDVLLIISNKTKKNDSKIAEALDGLAAQMYVAIVQIHHEDTCSDLSGADACK